MTKTFFSLVTLCFIYLPTAFGCSGGTGGGGSCGPEFHGINPMSSWEEIRKLPEIVADFHYVSFGLAIVPVSRVCLESDRATLNGGTTDVCVGYGSSRRDNCTSQQTVELKRSVIQVDQVCSNWAHGKNGDRCEGYTQVSYPLPLIYNVNVYFNDKSGREPHLVPLFQKPYTVPLCEEGSL